MDLMWRSLVSVSAMMCGGVCVVRRFCRSRMGVCIPLMLRVRAVMGDGSTQSWCWFLFPCEVMAEMLGYVGVWLMSRRMGLLVLVCLVVCVC